GGLEVEDDELHLLEQGVVDGTGERDGRTPADDPAVARRDLFQQGCGQAVRDRGRGEDRARRFGRRQRSALLEQVDEPIERVESELHSRDVSEHMFAWQVGNYPFSVETR